MVAKCGVTSILNSSNQKASYKKEINLFRNGFVYGDFLREFLPLFRRQTIEYCVKQHLTWSTYALTVYIPMGPKVEWYVRRWERGGEREREIERERERGNFNSIFDGSEYVDVSRNSNLMDEFLGLLCSRNFPLKLSTTRGGKSKCLKLRKKQWCNIRFGTQDVYH